jgi:hypothetical protein
MTCNIKKWLYHHWATLLLLLFLMACMNSLGQDNSQSFNQESVTLGFRPLI